MAGNHRTGLIALRGVLSTMELCLVCLTPLSKSNFRSTRGDIKDFHTGKRREPSLDHLWRRGFFANLTVECGRSALMGVLCANPSPSRVIMEHSGNGVTCFGGFRIALRVGDVDQGMLSSVFEKLPGMFLWILFLNVKLCRIGCGVIIKLFTFLRTFLHMTSKRDEHFNV